eukprot:6314692-Pyramimonas_sp.AAC.1
MRDAWRPPNMGAALRDEGRADPAENGLLLSERPGLWPPRTCFLMFRGEGCQFAGLRPPLRSPLTVSRRKGEGGGRPLSPRAPMHLQREAEEEE